MILTNSLGLLLKTGGGISDYQLLLPEYSLIEGFESVSEWTTDNGTGSNNTTQFKQGTQSIKLTAQPIAGDTFMSKTGLSLDLSDIQVFRMLIYCHDTNTAVNAQVRIVLSNDAEFNNYFVYTCPSGNFSPGTQGEAPYWRSINVLRSDFSSVGSPSWDSSFSVLRIRGIANEDYNLSLSFDNLIGASAVGESGIVIAFDDNRASHYDVAFAYMQPLGLIGTHYVITDTAEALLDLDEMQEMYSAGWDLANHTSDHTDLTTLSQAQAQVKISDAINWLNVHGWTRASHHLGYPYGSFNATVQAALAAEGMLTGRAYISKLVPALPTDEYVINGWGFESTTTTLAQAKTALDNAIARGEILCCVFHSLVESPEDENWSIDDFQDFIDYVIAQNVKSYTINQLYQLGIGNLILPIQYLTG